MDIKIIRCNVSTVDFAGFVYENIVLLKLHCFICTVARDASSSTNYHYK